MATSEHTEPVTHLTDDMPMIIAGNACGRPEGGLWFHGDRSKEKISKGGLTILRAAGVDIDRFGTPHDNDGAPSDPSTTETRTELEA